MAERPKRLKHEDRIKALEQRCENYEKVLVTVDVLVRDVCDKLGAKITVVRRENGLCLNAVEWQKSRPWYKRIFGL